MFRHKGNHCIVNITNEKSHSFLNSYFMAGILLSLKTLLLTYY